MSKHDDETEQQYLDRTYNGWEGRGNKGSAYATWRIALEIFDDPADVRDVFDERPSRYDLAHYLKDTAETYVCESVNDGYAKQLATQYALAFLDDVEWYEIAEHLLRDWPEEEEEEEGAI